MKPVIFGFHGTSLSEAEKDFFSGSNPFGFIIFQRNIADQEQLSGLLNELRAVCGRQDLPFFIDQEGGRAARLKPPHWPKLPPMRRVGMVYEKNPDLGIELMRLHALLTARMLCDLGIICNLAPVLDLFVEGADTVIGDRAISHSPQSVVVLGKTAVETYIGNGILPCIKHLPGHGRMRTDPHNVETIIDASRHVLEGEDFVPFREISNAPVGMNSHAIFTAFDSDLPASLSPKVHRLIREEIGFKGILLSDDMAMKAFDNPKYGDMSKAAARAIEAGTDIVLHCNGKLEEMKRTASALPEADEQMLARWERAKALLKEPQQFLDREKTLQRICELASEAGEYD